MRVVALVQARMGSARLPGKSLRPLAGQPMLAHVLERARAIPGVDEVVLATSDTEGDLPLLTVAGTAGVDTFVGSERDVLDRMWQAAVATDAEVVMRLTGDCPLLAPDVAAYVLDVFAAGLDASTPVLPVDYVSNDTSTTGYPDGTDVEVFTFRALDQAWRESRDQADREHVTRWIRRTLTCAAVRCPSGDYSALKLSVDTADDFERVRRVMAHLPGGDARFAATIEACRAAGIW